MWCGTIGTSVTLALSLLVAPCLTEAQPQATIPRIGVLTSLRNTLTPYRVTLQQALQELGYVEGQHIAFERRVADTPAQLPALATELVGLKVDIIVVQNPTMARAVQQVSRTIPIVMVNSADPVGTGLIASLARPGGNITGLTTDYPETSPKALALLKEAIPEISRVAVFHCPWPPTSREWEDLQGTAQRLGLSLHALAMQSPDLAHIEALFAAAIQERANALLALDCTHLVRLPREQMADLAMQHRLPGMYPWRSSVVGGGLLAYGPDLEQRWRRVAVYVEKLLKGAKPAELPVERPMKFELTVNLKTAAVLGITISPMLLFQADEVIR